MRVRQGRRLQPGGEVFGAQAFANGAEHQVVKGLAVAETDLDLGRVNVDVDLLRRQLEKEEGHGIAAGHQQAAVGFLERVAQAPVPDTAAVDKHILHLGRAAFAGRVTDVAAQHDRTLPCFERVELVAHLRTEEKPEALAQPGRGRDLVNVLGVMAQCQVQLRMGQGQTRERLAHVTHLGRRAAEKLAAHGRIEEEMLDLQTGPGRAVPGTRLGKLSAVTGKLGAKGVIVRPRLQRDLGNAADRGQRFAAKAQGHYAEEILGVGQFAGRMAGEGQRQILGGDAAAVIHDADQLDAALLDVHIDAAAASIDGIFQQLLDHARWPLDHLAGGDLGDDRGR